MSNITPIKLVQALETLTGADFQIDGNAVTHDSTFLTTEQHYWLQKVCGKTGLRMVIADPSYIAVDDIGPKAAQRVLGLAAEEPARVKRLQDGKALLEQATGVTLAFDEKHKMLVMQGLCEGPAGGQLIALDRDKIIARDYIMDAGERTVITDILDPEKLQQRANAMARLDRPPITRPGVPPKPEGGPGPDKK